VEKQLAREAGKLYALPEADYTKARNARAKELRSADPELAAAIAKLPKPSRPLATINHLAHEDPSEIRALIQSGKRLRKLQEDAVRGTSQPTGFAAASAEFREALDRVQRQARSRGLTDSLLVRVASTLRAAALDPELQPLLERGVLTQEPEPAGFAFDPSLVPAPTPVPAKNPKADIAKLKRAQRRVSDAKKNADQAQQALARARDALGAAEHAAAEASEALETAEADLEQLQQSK
jgi:hypothetical protein